MSGPIKVDYGTIHTAASDCESSAAYLQQRFEDLGADLKALTATWTGTAASEYDRLKREWDSSFSDLRALLHQVAVALPQIADGYQATDKGVQGLFSG